MKGVEAVERALTVLDAVARQKGPVTLHDLSLGTGFYKSTILRLLTSLERFGYIRRREDGRYILGPACAALSGAQAGSFDFSGLLRGVIARLCEETGETVSFYVRDGDMRVCAQRQNSHHSIRHHVDEGQRLPMERGSASLVLRAFEGEQGALFDRIRMDGYYVSLGERDPDAAGIAAPILGAKGELLGALTVSGLRSRFGHEAVDLMRDALLKARHELELGTGYSA